MCLWFLSFCHRLKEKVPHEDVVQGQRGCPGTERLSRDRGVVQGQRGCPGTERMSRDRGDVQGQRGCPGTERLSRDREDVQGQRGGVALALSDHRLFLELCGDYFPPRLPPLPHTHTNYN